MVGIASGDYHWSWQIKPNNTVVAWGYKVFRGFGANVPVGLSDVVAVDGGEEFGVAR